jgi:hypothetical protein
MQARRIEASVLTSLTELRAIEHQRIADERAAVDRAVEADREAKRAAEQAVRDAEAAKLAAERDERLRVEQARADAERELRLRVEATEAAERARHAAALDQERLREELELRRAELLRKRPTWMIAVTALAVAAGILLGVFAYIRSTEAADAQHGMQVANAAKEDAKREAREAREQLDRLEADLQALDGRVAAAQTKVLADISAAEREKARLELIELGKQQAAARKRIQEAKDRQWKIDRNQKINVDDCIGTVLCTPKKK